MIISEAPSKVILFGEHSVVYGYPALASAINLKTYVKLTETVGKTVIFSEPLSMKWAYGEKTPLEFKPLERIIRIVEDRYNIDLSRGLKLDISSEVRPGSGLGSSASVAAALGGALLYYTKNKVSLEELNYLAYEAEKVAHGTPSGIDNTVAVNGGIIKFVRTDNGPLIEKIRIPRDIPLIVVDTGMGKSTKQAVSKVRELLNKEYEIVKRIFEGIGNIVERIWNDFNNKILDLRRIGQLMNINHGLLSAIGVSNSRIEEIVHFAREKGALGAKLTGAGLGGYVLVLPSEDNIEEIYSALKNRYKRVLKVAIYNKGTTVKEL